MSNYTKCCMATYCIYSHDNKHCEADISELMRCPYYNAIGENATLSAELALKETELKTN